MTIAPLLALQRRWGRIGLIPADGNQLPTHVEQLPQAFEGVLGPLHHHPSSLHDTCHWLDVLILETREG